MSNPYVHNMSTPMTRYMNAHPYLSWADIEEVDEDDLLKYGFAEALRRAYSRSERLASSGMTSEIHRTHGRKGRKEHYTRKAKLEDHKEAVRRAQWLKEFPGAPEAAWARREERRQKRKASERRTRRIRKEINASRRRSSSGSRRQ